LDGFFVRHGVSGSSELIICLADNNVSAFHRMEFYSRLERVAEKWQKLIFPKKTIHDF
jgi:hypothetical protein